MMKWVFWLLILWTVSPQGQPVTITLALDPLTKLSVQRIISEFEAQYPGIQVRVINADYDEAFPGTPDYDEATRQYVQSADVLYFNSYTIRQPTTLAGYLLDLKPLIDADRYLQLEDFYPAVSDSYQWDGGFWALPIFFDLTLLEYDQEPFDEANLPYPTDNDSFAHFLEMARLLTLRDTDGHVLRYGAVVEPATHNALWIEDVALTDFSTIPNSPRFTQSDVIQLTEQRAAIESEGFIWSTHYHSGFPPVAPMRIGALSAMQSNNIVLLPGGHAGLNVSALAVSAATAYPEAAYKLASWLTFRHEIYAPYGDTVIPARRSLAVLSPQRAYLIERAVASAVPVSHTLFGWEFDTASWMVNTQKISAVEALRQAEAEILEIQQQTKSLHSPLMVDTRSPQPASVLYFGWNQVETHFPNQASWNQVINDFMQVEITISPQTNSLPEQFDCFYSTARPETFDERVLPLEPLMEADPTFDLGQFLPGTLEKVTYNGRWFAYPFDIRPHVLTSLNEAETASTFLDTLLHSTNRPAISSYDYVPHHMIYLMDIAGGLPVDDKTGQPRFTHPDVIEAAQQVLDLVHQDIVFYRDESNPYPIAPIMAGTLNPFSEDQVTLYPTRLIEFDVGAFYISANTPNPELCYRWFKTLEAHPALLYNGIPARSTGTSTGIHAQVIERLNDAGTLAFPSSKIESLLFAAFDRVLFEGIPLDTALAEAQAEAENLSVP